MCSPTLIDAPVKPMLPTWCWPQPFGQPRDLDVQLARELVGDVHRFDPLLHGLVEAHRARDPELARVGARARDDVGDLARAGVAEAELRQRAPDVVDALLAHPAQHEVLLHGRARVAAGVVAHDRRQAAELLGREVAARDFRLDRHEALLLLLAHVRARGSARTRDRSPFGLP